VVTLEGTLATNLFFELGLDGVEGEVFPAMLGLELGEGEAVLQVTGDLERKKKRSLATVTGLEQLGGRMEGGPPLCERELTLLTSARLSTLSTTSSGCFFQGEDMALFLVCDPYSCWVLESRCSEVVVMERRYPGSSSGGDSEIRSGGLEERRPAGLALFSSGC
jgi:hypothetical protein